MIPIRRQPNEIADALWGALRKSKQDGLSARAAENLQIASCSYARRLLHLWAVAGYADYYPPETRARNESGVYVMTTIAPRLCPVVTANGIVYDQAGAMTAKEFAMIRRKLGLSLAEMARALGREGHQPTLTRSMRRYEQGVSMIDEALAKKIRTLKTFAVEK